MDVEALIHSMVALIVTIIAILMLISMIRQFYFNNDKDQKYYSAIQHSSIICLIGYILRLSTLSMLHIPYYCPSCNVTHPVAVSFQIISALFLFLTKPLIQIHFIIRLYYTFKLSAFASSMSTYIILSTIIITEIVCILLYFVSGLIQLNGDKGSPLLVEDDFDDGDYGKPFESLFSIILLCIAVITDLIVSYVIMHLFISKLFELLITSIQSRDEQRPKIELLSNRDQINDDNDYNMNDLDLNDSLRKMSIGKWSTSSSTYSIMHLNPVKLTGNDNKMINTITRYTLLSCITMIFTQFYFLLNLIHIIWISSWNSNDRVSYHQLDAPLAALSIMDSVLAISAIYLNFTFSRKYYKIFCNPCHKGLENICKRLTTRKVIKTQEMSDDSYHSL